MISAAYLGLPARISSKIAFVEGDGCYLWTAARFAIEDDPVPLAHHMRMCHARLIQEVERRNSP